MSELMFYIYGHRFLQKMSQMDLMYQSHCCPFFIPSVPFCTLSTVLHPSAQQRVRRAAKAEGGIAPEGVVVFPVLSWQFEQHISTSYTFSFLFFF